MNRLLVILVLASVAMAIPVQIASDDAWSTIGIHRSWKDHGLYDYFAPAHYSFEYNIYDPYTGDIKNQHETRIGDNVKGYYAMKEADGTTRHVHYTADKHNGFNAIVTKTGHAVHPTHPVHLEDHHSLPDKV